MQNILQQLGNWRPENWREQLPLTPDALAQRLPTLYLLLVVLLMVLGLMLGLGFPFTALALLIKLPETIGSAATADDWAGLLLRLGIIIGAGAMTAFLWRLKMPLPSGQPLEAGERLPLDALIDSLQADIRLSRPHAVRITKRHQLTSVCIPRNGFALFHRRVLLLGLPTLQTLTAQQAEAAIRRVLCWPNTLQGWVLHAIACQYQCARRYQAAYRSQRTIAARIMAALFSLYLPLYRRFSTPALRWNELERDTLLVQQICVDDVLELLAVDTLVSRYLEEMFWPAMRNTARHDARPPYPHTLFLRLLRQQLSPDVIRQWLDEAAQQPQPAHAVTPAMSARMANLGSRSLKPVSLAGKNAAETLLPESLGSVIKQIDKSWRRRMRHQWHRAHAKHAKGRARLAAL